MSMPPLSPPRIRAPPRVSRHGTPVLQGDAGVSRKGPRTVQASYYYSVPHLDVSGAVTIDGKERAVRGAAWLDHEWSSE